jgi:hypothetical protein
MHPDPQHDDQQDLNDRPSLFVHSYPPPAAPAAYPLSDIGQRPVPPGVCWYLCTGIQALTPFIPGQKLAVQVTIGNSQGGNSATLANVAVWWAGPTSGPIVPDKKKFIGYATVAVAPHGGRATTVALTTADPIPVDAGPHICLFAKVWHALDLPATTLADPINDRHWAQHNLVTVQANSPTPIVFLVTNPATEPAQYSVRIRPADPGIQQNFLFDQPLRPVESIIRFALTDRVQGDRTRGEGTLERIVALEPGEQRELRLDIDPTDQLESGTFAAYEILQFHDGNPMGGIGIAVQAAQR